MRTLLLIILAAFFLVAFTHVGAVNAKSEYEEQFYQGNDYLDKGQFDQAITAYSEAIKLNPKSFEAYANRGGAYLDKGDAASAIPDLTKALELQPDERILDKRGLAFNETKQFDLAIADFNKAIGLNPKFFSAFYHRGLVHELKGDLDSAIDDYTKAIEINTVYEDAYFSRGRAYMRKGDHDRSLSDFNKIILLNPQSSKTYRLRASVYGAKGEYDLSIADFTKAIELDPKDFNSCTYRGLAYYRIGKHDLAISDFMAAIKIKPDYSMPAYGLAIINAKHNNGEQACKWLKRSIENGFTNFDYIKKDKDLDNIRDAVCYKKLLSGK